MSDPMHQVIQDLFKIGGLKFGSFTLKSGIESPIYIDLRILVSHPTVMKSVAKEYAKLLENLAYDRIAGVAYAALPIASAISLELEQPWMYARKELKGYGTNKQIGGEFHAGETIVVADDMVTDGESKLEAIKLFEAAGCTVKDVVILLDRDQGGKERLAEKGYVLHSVMTLTDALAHLRDIEYITAEEFETTREFLANTRPDSVKK